MTEKIDFSVLQPINFVLAGVGGQGTILASDILAEVGLRLGYDVKKAEIHGMSQRGGSVTSNLRWGPKVFSPIVPRGGADVFIAFEKLEASRFAEYLRPGGLALVNDYAISPVTVSSGNATYPGDDEIRTIIAHYAGEQYWVKGIEIAEMVGNSRAANVVMIGAFTAMVGIDGQVVLDAIAARVPPKHLDINRSAFQAGFEAIRALA